MFDDHITNHVRKLYGAKMLKLHDMGNL